MPDLRWGATTNPGRVRSDNEDTFVAEPMVFAVADGMGGHQAGEIASALAASIIRDRLSNGSVSEDYAVSVVNEANAAIHGAARVDASKSGMGTTLTAIAVLQATDSMPEQLVLLNVGDSRTYRFRGGRLQRVTVDHSYVQELVATGHITIEEARTHPRRNIVTRALGIEPSVRTDMWTLPIVRGDRFVLCSDGLVDEVPDDEILDLVAAVADPQSLSEQLVELANRHGGRDNVTVVIVDVLDGAEPPDPTGEMPYDPAWATEGAGSPPIWAETDGVDAAPGATAIGEQPTAATSAATAVASGAAASAASTGSTAPTVPPPAAPLSGVTSKSGDSPASGSEPTTVEIPVTAAPTSSADSRSTVATAPAATATSDATEVASLTAPVLPPGKPTPPGKPSTPTLPAAASMPAPDVVPAPTTVAPKPRRRRLTGGLFLFIVVLAAIITVTFTLIAVHARSGYYVGFEDDTVVVFKGQPGGLLWFHPTVAQKSSVTRADLDPTLIAVINEHVTYDSAEEAAQFITDQVIPTTTTEAPTTTTTTTPETTTTAATAPGETTTTVSSGP